MAGTGPAMTAEGVTGRDPDRLARPHPEEPLQAASRRRSSGLFRALLRDAASRLLLRMRAMDLKADGRDCSRIDTGAGHTGEGVQGNDPDGLKRPRLTASGWPGQARR